MLSFNVTKDQLAEPIKYMVGYVLIYALLRLSEYGLMKLLVSGYADQSIIQYAVFVGAVIAGLAAQLLVDVGIAVVAIFAATLIVLYLRKTALAQHKQPVKAKPAADYVLNRYVMTFGEKIERPKAKAKPKAEPKKPAARKK